MPKSSEVFRESTESQHGRQSKETRQDRRADAIVVLCPKDSLKSLHTIDESVKGAASLRRYGITFADNIDVLYLYLLSQPGFLSSTALKSSGKVAS